MIEQRSENFINKYGIADWGDFNHPPTPYQECDVSEMFGFWHMIDTYGFPNAEFRQVYLDDAKYTQNVHICIWFDRIFMFKVDRIKVGDDYKEIPKCYRIGCVHEYDDKILNSRSGDCEKICRKCGFTYQYNCGD